MAKRASFFAVLQLSLVAAIFLAGTSATQHDHLLYRKTSKDPRCHIPRITDCNSSMYPILNYKVAAWAYHTLFRSCRPVYVENGNNSCLLAKDNLPSTRDECERICGDLCADNGPIGICAFEEHCLPEERIPTTQPRPCIAYGVKCCNRPGPKAPAAAAVKASPAQLQRVRLRPVNQNSIADERSGREPFVAIVN